jgi:hypothetical protein
MGARGDSPPAVARREVKGRAALHVAYREGLGLAAIVTTCEGAATRIVAIAAAQAGAAPCDEGAFVARFWCRRTADADRVALAATARLRRRGPRDDPESSSSSASAPAVNICAPP